MRTVLLAALALAGCSPQVAQRAGGDLPTIVSLNPCTDAILVDIADPSQILALSHYSHDPQASSMDVARARRFAATGGTVEEVLALDPDLVIGSSFMPPATRAALEDLGLEVATFGITGSIADSERHVAELAQLAGHPERGAALNARIRETLERWEAEPGKRRAAIVWQPGGIVPGDEALVSEVLRRTGFDNASARDGLGQADYLSLESVLSHPPELLLVAGREVGQRHPTLDAVPGLRRENLDPNLLYCGGPTIARAAERLGRIRASMP